MVDVLSEMHLFEQLCSNARHRSGELAVRFILNTEGDSEELTWEQLWTLAWRVRSGFQDHDVKRGQRVLLMLPTGVEYLACLLGAMWYGLVPCSLAPLNQLQSSLGSIDEVDNLVQAFNPDLIVSNSHLERMDICCLVPRDLMSNDACAPGSAEPFEPQSPMYVQFSSGSTGLPKGIALDWGAVHCNLRAIIQHLKLGPHSRIVSWLPVYHDMGLFGTLLSPLLAGSQLVLMDPGLFVASPMLWLRIMTRERATVTSTPPSALQFCLKFLQRRPQKDLDLSSLELIICGSEPVSPRLVTFFQQVLMSYGVRPEVLKPVYGLAEATLAVTMTPLDCGALIDTVDQQILEQEHRTVAIDSGVEIVSAGYPLPGFELKVCDSRGNELAERNIGRLQIKSPSLLSGFMQRGVFKAIEGQWLDSGDLAYVADGQLYVTGRRKDIIIKNGRNYSPSRLEDLACLADSVQRAVAFGVFDEDKLTEQIIMMVEVRRKDLAERHLRDQVRLTVRAHLHEAGYQTDEVLLVEKGSLPRTTSGKIKRQQCKMDYLQQATEQLVS